MPLRLSDSGPPISDCPAEDATIQNYSPWLCSRCRRIFGGDDLGHVAVECFAVKRNDDDLTSVRVVAALGVFLDIDRRKREYVEFMRSAIRELRAAGRVMDVDATVATQATLAMILWLPRWLNPRGRLTPTQAGTQVAGMALRALFSRRPRRN